MTALATVTALPGAQPKRARKRYVTQPEHVIRQSVEALARVYDSAGRLTKADYQREADRLGVTSRTVENWWSTAVAKVQAAEPQVGRSGFEPVPPRRRTAVTFTAEHYPYFAGVSISNAYYEMIADDIFDRTVHYSTFRRAYTTQVPRDIRSGLRRGEKVMPNDWAYGPGPQTALGKVYTTDLFFPRIYTCDDTTGELLGKVTFVVIRDTASRLPLSWHLFDHAPVSAEITALVGEAVRGWTHDGVFCGGVPDKLRCDNEGLLEAAPHREQLMNLRIVIDPTNSYASWENGQHERMHRVIREEALADLPGHTDGPRTRSNELYLVPDVAPVPFSTLALRLDAWVRSYAFEREIDGKTPFETWRERADAGEQIVHADAEGLAHLALLHGHVTLGKKGVRILGEDYWGPELGAQPTRDFVARRWLNDPTIVEVLTNDGRYLGSIPARRNATGLAQSQEQQRRSGSLRTVAAAQREAQRRRALRSDAVIVSSDDAHVVDHQPNQPDANVPDDANDDRRQNSDGPGTSTTTPSQTADAASPRSKPASLAARLAEANRRAEQDGDTPQ
jgi:hypothetical protein